MNYLLVGGASNVGKSETIYRLAIRLLASGYSVVAGTVPTVFTDFKAIVKGNNSSGNIIYVLLNSPTDDIARIGELKQFYDESAFPINMVISSIRGEDEWQRRYVFTHMEIKPPTDFVIEIPLARITRRGINFWPALNWYQQTVDEILTRTLAGNPFNI